MTRNATYETLNSIAKANGYQSGFYAAAKVLGRSISNMQRKGITSAEIAKVIAALEAED